MKRSSAVLALVAVFALATLAFTSAVTTSGVDTQASFIVWKGYKVTGQHHGKVLLKAGDLKFDSNNKLTGGSFEIDMTTITCEDLPGGGQKLVGHLKSDDFFGVEKYPTAKFVITKASEAKPGEYRIKGDLTIKATTKPISFDARISDKEGKKVAIANIKIDRSEYDIRFGSGSFFENLGDKTIYDEFDLEVNLAIK
ncbi:MAG: YceI family protein [Saprospiraceae bacterium]|nr:YceI family protein [Saprospiraceae bacterium]